MSADRSSGGKYTACSRHPGDARPSTGRPCQPIEYGNEHWKRLS